MKSLQQSAIPPRIAAQCALAKGGPDPLLGIVPIVDNTVTIEIPQLPGSVPAATPATPATPGTPARTGTPDTPSSTALEPQAASRRRGRKRRQFPIVHQIDETDCGVACLAMVAKWHGIEVAIPSLRDVVGTTVSGTTLRSIATAGGHIGLQVQPMKVSRDRLNELALPAIIHWRGDHWVVLVRADEAEAEVELADPAIGRRVVSRDELSQHWDGFAAIVTPTGEPPDVGLSLIHI